MISAIQQWGFSLCIACVCGGVLKMASPSKGMESIFKVAVSIFFISCIVIPLVGLKDTEIEMPDYSNYEQQSDLNETVAEQIAGITATNLRIQVKGYLDEQDLPYKKVETIVNTSETGSIDIREIQIVSDGTKDDVIKNRLEEQFSIPVTVSEEE